MPKRSVVFYAFPSKPADIAETIVLAIKRLTESADIRQANVRFKPWPHMTISGHPLSTAITANISRAQVFACDLTFPNPNVTFELGYAISTNKRVFASINTTIQDAERNYRKLFFNTLGMAYSPYENSLGLQEQLRREAPWRSPDQVFLHDRFRRPWPRPEYPSLLYVRPQVTTDSIVSTLEALRESSFSQGLIIDDPKDNPSSTLDWYAENILIADAVLIHLTNDEHAGHEQHNVKASLIAGLALGFNKELLMLAHGPFESPVDYGHLIQIHSTADACSGAARRWLEQVGKDLPRRRYRSSKPDRQRGLLDLRALMLGQHFAENERQSLDNYFIETQAYLHAMQGPTTILVGRRGTGKTANLYTMQTVLSRDPRNHVTLIYPVGYEMDGVLRILSELQQRSERGYLIESLWKYLIYSEISASVERSLRQQPIYQPKNAAEAKFLEYCESHSNIIQLPFSERLKHAVSALKDIGSLPDDTLQRTRISEAFHNSLIGDLRAFLGKVLGSKQKVAVLIDNLDEPWTPGEHVALLADMLTGLLKVSQDIAEDLRHSDSRRHPVNAIVTVVLRSDIFSFIHPTAAEQDKLPIERTFWDDPELLLRVLDERLLHGLPASLTSQDVWTRLFPTEVVGVRPSDFILRTTLPRPRDVIFLLKAAVGNAIDRNHSRIEPADLLYAREQYSEFALRSVLSEDNPRKGKLEAVLYEFAGAGRRLTRNDIEIRMNRAGVAPDDVNYYIDLLCDINFLAIETATGFRYSRHEGDRAIMREVAQRIANARDSDTQFELNPAFYQALQIE